MKVVKILKILNQILYTGINDTSSQHSSRAKEIFFKFQLILSISILIVIIIISTIYFNNLYKNEKLATSLISNYNVYKLYNSPNSASSQEYSNYENLPNNQNTNSNSNSLNTIFGIIEIPKIAVYYPIFNNISEDLLKISPCRFSGESLNKNDNICIAGHNYDNSLFFSKIVDLSNGDEIFIFDNSGEKYIYYVYDIYEVNQHDLSPIFDYDKNTRTLTLVTCNNFNSNRIIVRAKQK